MVAWTDVFRYHIYFGGRIPRQGLRLTTCIYDTPLLERNMVIFAHINHHLYMILPLPIPTLTRTTGHARYFIVRFKNKAYTACWIHSTVHFSDRGSGQNTHHIDRSLCCLTPNPF